MQMKKRKWKLARELRKRWNLSFVDSQQLAKQMLRDNLYNGLLRAGFWVEPKMAVTCSRGCCREAVGSLYIGYDADGKTIILNKKEQKELEEMEKIWKLGGTLCSLTKK